MTEMAEIKTRKHHPASHDEDEPMSDREREERAEGGSVVSEDPEWEEGVDSQTEEDRIRRKEAKRMEVRRSHEDHFRSGSSSKHHYHYHHHKSRSVPFVSTAYGGGQRYTGVSGGMTVPASPSYRHHHEGRGGSGGGGNQNRAGRPWDEELDGEGELDAEGDYWDDERPPPTASSRRSNPQNTS